MRVRWFARLLHWAVASRVRREPDVVIGDRYMLRWHLIRRNRWFNIYLHHILHSDDDRALHDHPFSSVSLCLAGRVIEHRSVPSSYAAADHNRPPRLIEQGSVVPRRADVAHRLELFAGEDCWTLFVAGPRVREWGFWCPQGWRHWREYTDPENYGQVGRGCAED